MFKLTNPEDLEKAGRTIGTFFAAQAAEMQKSFTFHKALAMHHDGLHKRHTSLHKGHTDRAAEHKAHADGLDAGDPHKAHFLKAVLHHSSAAEHHLAAAEHHGEMAKAHHEHADGMKAQMDSMKALSADWGAAVKADTPGAPLDVAALAKGEGSLDARVAKLSEALVAKAFEALNTNPTIGEKIQEIVLAQIEKTVGGKLVPDNVHKVVPDIPGLPGSGPNVLTAVPRTGAAPIAKANVPLQFEKMFKVDGGDDE
jgi:hypothetical protein